MHLFSAPYQFEAASINFKNTKTVLGFFISNEELYKKGYFRNLVLR